MAENPYIMEEKQSDYLNKHLPYRINSLLAYDLIIYRRDIDNYNDLKERCYKDSLVLDPTFEISIVFGRALLHFLGIDYDSKKADLKPFKKKSYKDDYTIKDLFEGRSFCPIDDEIVVENKRELCTIIKIANKSVAHLTETESNDSELELLKPARMAIYKLMLKYIPEINKEKIWWYSQVENR